jgi:hypothetical protein
MKADGTEKHRQISVALHSALVVVAAGAKELFDRAIKVIQRHATATASRA